LQLTTNQGEENEGKCKNRKRSFRVLGDSVRSTING